MNNFERRGLPFRDVFDSSFDSILYVDYLNLQACRRLLEKRVIGRPIPFFALAYCFSGGLPRDIIRYFREIMRNSEKNTDIREIVRKMVTEDIRAKCRAISSHLRSLDTLAQSDQVVSLLFDLQDSGLNLKSMERSVQSIFELWTILEQKKGLPKDELKKVTTLCELIEELGSYLAYLCTVWEIFTEEASPIKIERLVDENSFDRLARARQAFSEDYSLARRLIREYRNHESMQPLPLGPF